MPQARVEAAAELLADKNALQMGGRFAPAAKPAINIEVAYEQTLMVFIADSASVRVV
jgi:hypothetical protein